jgi:hypothetical protein
MKGDRNMNYPLQELEKRYKALGEQIEKLKQEEHKIGFKDDRIFLLSIEEYEKYKKVIPHKNCCWWLRSPGQWFNYTAFVTLDDSVCDRGSLVYDTRIAIRPAIKYSETKLHTLNALFTKYGTTWVVIDPFEQIAIAENPIHFMEFDRCRNDYESSDIRAFLLQWDKERECV